MNINTLLWVLQIILAIKGITSAFTHTFQHSKPAMQEAIGKVGGSAKPLLHAISLLLLIVSLGLVLPGVMSLPGMIVPFSAAGMAAMMLVSLFFHVKYREKPLIFADLILFALCAFTAYARAGSSCHSKSEDPANPLFVNLLKDNIRMPATLTSLALLVRDYDEAINWFSQKCRFTLLENNDMGDGKRWVLMKPSGEGGASLLLAKAACLEQESCIGNQTGGRVFLFLHTSDFWEEYNHMRGQGVQFLEEPRQEPYGTVVVFQDLYGNKWDLIQPRNF